MNAIGLIFANIHDTLVPELTKKRTLASVPFGGRYRLIDFAMSNMVNSNINKVGVMTKNNYQSLMDHLSGGKDWDLARKNGGLFILPPFGISDTPSGYDTRLESLHGALDFISHSIEEYAVLSDGDDVSNLDLDEMLDYHLANNNDITVAYKQMRVDKNMGMHVNALDIDDGEEISGILVPYGKAGKANVSMNVWLLSRELLLNLITNSYSRGYTHWNRDVIGKNAKRLRIGGWKCEGTFFVIDSIVNYFDTSMQLLDTDIRNELFHTPYRSIYTKVKDSAPTKFFDNAKVSNSLIADGCKIDGTVVNCILSRDVVVSRGVYISNCIIMQNTYIGENTKLNFVVTDKNVVIRPNHNLSGCKEQPYILSKSTSI